MFRIPFSKKLCLSLHLFWLLHRNIRTVGGCPSISRICSTVRTVEMDRQAVTRRYERTQLHHFHCGVISTQSSTARSSSSRLTYLPHASTSVLERYASCRVYCVGSGTCSSDSKLERSVNCGLSSEAHLPASYLSFSFDFNHSFRPRICATRASKEPTALGTPYLVATFVISQMFTFMSLLLSI